MYPEQIILYLVFCALLSKAYLAENLYVKIANGLIQGQLNYTVGQQKPFYSFRGIPYAEPPTGDRRFEPPVPKSDWNGVLDATRDSQLCVQGSNPVVGSEDCLYVNIYTPRIPDESCQLLPTMVWIFGGGFVSGSATYAVYGADYFLEKNTTVVTFSYRVSVFGFLSTQDAAIPGNNGLKDQLLLLKWVQNNIKYFCGDPEQITLAGGSAGSASVAYHLLSPKSKGLFHRAVLQSGSSLNAWSFNYNPAKLKEQFALKLGISYNNSEEYANILRNISASQLQAAAASFGDASNALNWGPVSEVPHANAFFTGKSHDLFSRGIYNHVPVLIGYDSLEAYIDLNNATRKALYYSTDLKLTRLLPVGINVKPSKRSFAAVKIKQAYFGCKLISESNYQTLKFFSDNTFIRGIIETGNQLRKKVSVYFYEFSYNGCLGGFYDRPYKGVRHSEEITYMWRTYFNACSNQDFEVRDRMVKLWTNFIKYGNPTPIADRTLQYLKWLPHDQNFSYVNIGDDLKLENRPNKHYTSFWNNLYAQYGQGPFDTY